MSKRVYDGTRTGENYLHFGRLRQKFEEGNKCWFIFGVPDPQTQTVSEPEDPTDFYLTDDSDESLTDDE